MMPIHSLSLLCSPFSATKNIDRDIHNDTTKKSGITPPTPGQYAVQTARDFLAILDAVARAVPLPGFNAAVKVAVDVIKACDEYQETLESAKQLKVRIQGLLVVFVDKLKEAKKEDIRPELIGDVDIFTEEMEYIKTTLEEITSQHRFIILLFRKHNNDKVSECVKRLDNAMEKFTLKRFIDNADMLTQLQQHIVIFYDEQKALYNQHQEDINIVRFGMDDVKAMLNERLPAGTMPLSSRAPIPSNLAIFHGRGSLVDELVDIITGASRKHICLLGPGGMGKTSTSLAVMRHPKVTAHFADDLCVWVPCVKATSASLFLNTLQTSLAIPKDAGDIRGAIITTLRVSPPIVILLDNFETPWNADGAQMEIAQFLRDIHAIPHVTLFITMRSSAPPCDGIPWHHVDLRGVDPTAAKDIYTAKHPEAHDDPNLPRLLELIGHMPLAIMLMAKVAKVTHLSATELINEYGKLGTSMLGQGSDAVSSMDVCIGLSAYNSRMTAHPEAFDLLCALSMLPTGTSYNTLSKWWANSLTNLPGALDILRDASLVEERGSTYFVLPVIQHYILNPTRFNHKIRMTMIEFACAFLNQHKSKPGEPSYKSHVAALSEEADNLEAVLLQVTTPDPRIIRDGLLLLARYQQDNRPRVDIVQHALKLMQNIDDNLLRGEVLYCHGDISEAYFQYEKSLQQFQEALNLFISVSDIKKAAETRLAISRILHQHSPKNFDLRQQLIREAQKDFESINHEGGVGQCYLALGDLNIKYRKFSVALTSLEEAGKISVKIGDQNQHARCTGFMAQVYYYTCRYDSAYSWATLSLEEYERIGYSCGCWSATHVLGWIASAQGDYKTSLQHFLQNLNVCKSMGLLPLGLALEGLGVAWTKLGKVVDARRAFEEGLQQYSSSESTWDSRNGIIRSRFFLKHLENPNLRPDTEELGAFKVQPWYHSHHLDRILVTP